MKAEGLVVDDHTMVCEAIAALVEKSNLIQKVHIAFSGSKAIEMLKSRHIKVVFIDARMPGMSGPEFVKVVLQDFPFVRIIGMTSFEDDTVMDMLRAPVHGMLLKANTNGEEVAQCLFKVLNGFAYYTPEIQAKINSGQFQLQQRSRTLLTKRDQEILVCMSEGKSAKEIAKKLGLKVSTVEDYRKAMLRKTQTSNSAGLMAFAHRNGLL